MSVIALADAKDYLEVIHSADDAKLQALLDGAEQEALDYMDRSDFTSICPICDEDCPDPDSDCLDEESEAREIMSEVTAEYGMPASVRTGILFLLQSAHQASPDERMKLREAAMNLLAPYRCGWGA